MSFFDPSRAVRGSGGGRITSSVASQANQSCPHGLQQPSADAYGGDAQRSWCTCSLAAFPAVAEANLVSSLLGLW